MKKVIVTGSGTFMGNHIANFLLKKGFFVYFLYNNTKPKINYKKNFRLIKLDLKKKIMIKREIKVDYLIHCASAVPSNNLSKTQMYKINCNGLKKILSKFIIIKKIIFISSMSVYGLINSKKINEKTKSTNPDFYGITKKKCEDILINHIKKNNLQLIILRLPGIIGQNSKNNFLSSLKHKFINDLPINVSNLRSKFNNVMHIENLSNIIFQSIKINNKLLLLNIANLRPILISTIIKFYKNKFKKSKSKIIIKKGSKSFLIDTKNLKKYFRIWSTKSSIIKYLNEN